MEGVWSLCPLSERGCTGGAGRAAGVRLTAKDGWEESEVSPFVEGMVLDVAGLAREAVVLSVPPLVVCSSSCRGLCPPGGQDLNVEQQPMRPAENGRTLRN